MTPPDLTTAAGWGVAIISAIFGAAEYAKNRKRNIKTDQETQLLSDAKVFEERARILLKLADDNLALYKNEHGEHIATRQYWHTKATEYQATLSACQEQLAELKSRPDLSDVMGFIRQQAQTSVEILMGIKEILVAIKDQRV